MECRSEIHYLIIIYEKGERDTYMLGLLFIRKLYMILCYFNVVNKKFIASIRYISINFLGIMVPDVCSMKAK